MVPARLFGSRCRGVALSCGDEGGTATLPEGIDAMAAGAGLAAVLKSVSASAVSAWELPVLLRAAWRQLNRDTARLYAVLRESALGDRDAPGGRRAGLDEFSADEARATLVLTKTAAWRMTGMAEDLAVRVPAVAARLWDGVIDEPRARAFTDTTAGLSPEHTDRVVQVLLPEAPSLTAYELRQRIEEVADRAGPAVGGEPARRGVSRGVCKPRVDQDRLA